jgi:hypothetical protein
MSHASLERSMPTSRGATQLPYARAPGFERNHSSDIFRQPAAGIGKQVMLSRFPIREGPRVLSVTQLSFSLAAFPSRMQPPPDKLHPTLSSWVKNINKLDSLINRLQELASSAPIDHRSQLLNKVSALRATFKKQQERYIEFLQLSEDYANKYLLDIDAEIRQQSTLLDNLEERLEAAKKLHGDAVDLQMLYESGTVASMNDLRATGKAVPCCPQRLQGKLLRPSNSRYFTATSTGQCPVQRG